MILNGANYCKKNRGELIRIIGTIIGREESGRVQKRTKPKRLQFRQTMDIHKTPILVKTPDSPQDSKKYVLIAMSIF